MFSIEPIALAQAALIQLPFSEDKRGNFTKVFQDSIFFDYQLPFQLKESYFSFSKQNVIRGMHFQLPEAQHSKIVFCPKGSILDCILDLRKDSSTYGQFFSVVLSENNHKALYVPEGFAHGFQSLEDDTMTYYLVSSEYDKEKDTGIKWSSFGMNWKTNQPIISERDQSFMDFKDFKSPF